MVAGYGENMLCNLQHHVVELLSYINIEHESCNNTISLYCTIAKTIRFLNLPVKLIEHYVTGFAKIISNCTRTEIQFIT